VYELNLEVVDDEEKPVAANVHLVCRDMQGEAYEVDGESGPDGGVSLEVPAMSKLEYVVAQREGFWTFHSPDVEDFSSLQLQRLPELDEPAWWLRALGIDTGDADRGCGIRIAVVDADFRFGAGLEEVKGWTEDGSRDEQSWGQNWGHGEMVCRILCDRQSTSSAYFSAAPGADVVFVDAAGKEGGVDPAIAISAIYKLITEDDVHLINLSWGDSEETMGLKSLINVASSMGVTIVAASGNEASEPRPLYPARSPGCIGVGAFGRRDWAPPNTMAGSYDTSDRGKQGKVPGFGPIFAWSECSFGEGMDALGPGVGILVQRENSVSFDLSGTSFAVPLVVGALAIALSQDKQYVTLPNTSARTKHARDAFVAMCRRTGLPRRMEGLGVPVVPPR
jgi:subtilisin family serine protease